MTVLSIIEKESDAKTLVAWGISFAYADHDNLLVVVPRRSKGAVKWEPADQEAEGAVKRAVFEALDSADRDISVLKSSISKGDEVSDHDRVVIEFVEVHAPDPYGEIASRIEDKDLHLLVLPARQPVTQGSETNWHHRLFSHVASEVVVVRGSLPSRTDPLRVLVASENEYDDDTETAIRRGCQLAAGTQDGSVSLLLVRPDDDEVAPDIAQKHLERMERQVADKKLIRERSIQLADSLTEGIVQQDLENIDVVLVGNRRRKILASLLRSADSWDKSTTAIAVIRHGVPITTRLWIRFRDTVRKYVPQIHRELRVSLVDRLQNSSNFDFDFLALISLSTLIAALGLVRNSSAVVIGAMLIAPLMTPLVAIGFSLIQGNLKLMKSAIKSVILGFTIALGIGVFTGLTLYMVAEGVGVTAEMKGREAPNLLDLVVALASGLAAAYAMGRSNLVSALPGVAIAAALVPPIATSGLALALGDLGLFGGALLLFATNIVAIVLGTAITFWAVGINDRSSGNESRDGRKPVRWPLYCFIGLVIVSFVLAAEINIHNPIDVNSGERPVDSEIIDK